MPLKSLRSFEILTSTTSQTALAGAYVGALASHRFWDESAGHKRDRASPTVPRLTLPAPQPARGHSQSTGQTCLHSSSSHFERTGSCCSGRTYRNSSSAQAARPARACSPGPCGRRTGSDPERRNLCARRRTTSARCRSPHLHSDSEHTPAEPRENMGPAWHLPLSDVT